MTIYNLIVNISSMSIALLIPLAILFSILTLIKLFRSDKEKRENNPKGTPVISFVIFIIFAIISIIFDIFYFISILNQKIDFLIFGLNALSIASIAGFFAVKKNNSNSNRLILILGILMYAIVILGYMIVFALFAPR